MGRGEEACALEFPLSSLRPPLVPRGEWKKTRRRAAGGARNASNFQFQQTMKSLLLAPLPMPAYRNILWIPNPFHIPKRIRIPVLIFQVPASFTVPIKQRGGASGAPISESARGWRGFGIAPIRRSALLCLAALVIAATGCQKAPPATESTDVRVEGDKVVVAPGSPPASSIAVATSAPPTATVLSFNGRLVWDDNVTTRLFSPFGGRVTKISVDVG